MKSQVTTKRGDLGATSALDGARYSKSHPIMDCVGTLDELRAHMALLHAQLEEHHGADPALLETLCWALHACFIVGSACSDPLGKRPQYHQRRITEREVRRLETEQLRLETDTPLPAAFVVAASNSLAAQADVACTVARRLERAVVRLKEQVPEFEPGVILVFLNRLSDFLYIVARYLERPRHRTVDYTVLD